MSTINIFDRASRLKLRFETARGALSVEDIWELPLQSNKAGQPNLDDLAREYHLQLKGTDGISFVTKTAKPSEALQLRFDIVTYIIDVKLDEAAQKEAAELARQRKARVLELINQKEDAQLSEKSLEELRTLANAL